MKNNKNLKACIVCWKVSLAVFGVMTVLLLGKTAQLITLYFSKGWFAAEEWAQYFRYPGYVKYLLIIQIISLVILVLTSRIKKQQ